MHDFSKCHKEYQPTSNSVGLKWQALLCEIKVPHGTLSFQQPMGDRVWEWQNTSHSSFPASCCSTMGNTAAIPPACPCGNPQCTDPPKGPLTVTVLSSPHSALKLHHRAGDLRSMITKT